MSGMSYAIRFYFLWILGAVIFSYWDCFSIKVSAFSAIKVQWYRYCLTLDYLHTDRLCLSKSLVPEKYAALTPRTDLHKRPPDRKKRCCSIFEDFYIYLHAETVNCIICSLCQTELRLRTFLIQELTNSLFWLTSFVCISYYSIVIVCFSIRYFLRESNLVWYLL